jgi:HD-like signal output (HDOD) protein
MPSEDSQVAIPVLLEFSSQLPASPKIFSRLSKLIEDEDTGLDYIASLIKMDPSIAAHILRVTNSAYYGCAVKLNDIESAIARIGFNEVHKALSVVIAHDCFYQALPIYGITATEYADECIAVAVASEVVAKRTGDDLNAPYITGLLHAIGKLAINLYFEKLGRTKRMIKTRARSALIEAESERFGITHLQAGFELLRHWQFEPEIWQPIRQQSNPKPAARFLRSTAILTAAIWLAENLKQFDPDSPLPSEFVWALEELNLDTLETASLIDSTRFEFNDRQNLFSMLI